MSSDVAGQDGGEEGDSKHPRGNQEQVPQEENCRGGPSHLLILRNKLAQSAGVDVLGLCGSVQGRFRGAAVDFGEGVLQQLDGGQDL